MAITLITSQQKTITIEDQPFAKGGEGRIHRVISPAAYKNDCVKLYESRYRTTERQNKINFLIQHSPAHLQNNDYMVCFPKELVFLNQQFVGFIMPLAFQDSIQLEALCTPTIRPLHKNHAAKFARDLPDAFRKRLQLCLNLATPVYLVHQLNSYVFVDIKPQNILVTPDSKISIIDIDSVQIAQGNRVIHAAHVTTPGYCPPESWNIKKGNYIPVSSDRFALAVIFYQILFGIHPYTASFKIPYAHVTEIADFIRNGLFVHGHNASSIHKLPAPHQDFRQLDSTLQGLFIAAFELGLYDPNKRPTLDDWGQAFFSAVNSKTTVGTYSSITQPQPTHIVNNTQTTASLIYAGFWKRLVAYSIDVTILFASAVMIKIGLDEWSDFSRIDRNIVASLIMFFISWFYFAILESSSSQASFGKKALEIKVTDVQGNSIGFGRATWHLFWQFTCLFIPLTILLYADIPLIIPCAVIIVQMLMLLFTDKKQALHNKLAGCLVILK